MAAANSKYACSLENDKIKISRNEPATCGNASLTIEFIRTIKVPDNSPAAKLPSGLGRFPLSKVNDYVDKLPLRTRVNRGLFFPMHGDESMWISFRAECSFIVKVYAAGVNAVSGEPCFESPDTRARRWRQIAAGESVQDYMLVEPNRQQFCSLDGMAVAPGVFRQFETGPSPGQRGYSTEVLMSSGSHVGDLQFEITMEKSPLIRDPPYVSPSINPIRFNLPHDGADKTQPQSDNQQDNDVTVPATPKDRLEKELLEPEHTVKVAAGGTINQNIEEDDCLRPDRWDSDHTITIPVHILNPVTYRQVTGCAAPPSPVTNDHYLQAGLSVPSLDNERQDSSDGSLQRIIHSKLFRARIRRREGGDSWNPPRTVWSEDRGSVYEGDGSTGLVKLHGVVDDPDSLISQVGPFRPFRTLIDMEEELQPPKQPNEVNSD